MPSIFTGLRIGAGLCVVGALVADFFFSRGDLGLGRLLNNYAKQLQYERLFGGVILASLLGVSIYGLISWLSNRSLRSWHESEVRSFVNPARRHHPHPTIPEHHTLLRGRTPHETNHQEGLALVVALGAVVAACGSDDDAATEPEATDAATEATDAATETTDDMTETTDDMAEGDTVCPTNLVIQTDWWPETEHGGTYQLIGAGGESDASLFTYSGPIDPAYAVGGIETVEIRAGGDAIEFQPVPAVMKTNQDITLGYVNTDDIIETSPNRRGDRRGDDAGDQPADHHVGSRTARGGPFRPGVDRRDGARCPTSRRRRTSTG